VRKDFPAKKANTSKRLPKTSKSEGTIILKESGIVKH